MGGVRARVRTRDGWTPRAAVLTVTDSAGSQVLRLEADDEGVLRSDAPLPDGAYAVVVTARGCAPAATTTTVTSAGTVDLGTLVLAPDVRGDLPGPGRWTIDPARSRVAATAQHLGIPSVRGRFTAFTGTLDIAETPEESSVEAVIRADSLDTGNAMRDRHLRSADFLDVASHPEIGYRASRVSAAGTGAGAGHWTVHGRLTLRGVVRDVDLDLTCEGTRSEPDGGERVTFRATAELRRRDFTMAYSQVVAAGMAAIGTTLKVELEIQAVREHTPGDG
jgi:polyisoprenoid-binding protein YceI